MADRKPRKCPECGSDRVVPIAYGLPGPELAEAARREEVLLGGCCVSAGDPEWGCLDCGWTDVPAGGTRG